MDEVLAQIETDKVTIDVRYTTGKAGKLTKMLIKEEDTVSVGQEVAVVEEGAEGSSGGGGGKKEVSVGTAAPPGLQLVARDLCGRACGQYSREGNNQLLHLWANTWLAALLQVWLAALLQVWLQSWLQALHHFWC